MFATKILIVCLFVFIDYSVSGCPPNFERFKNHCYSFVTDTVTWGDAQAICQTYHATLAEPRNKEINDWVKDQLKSRRMTRAWIGGYDIFQEGKWRWEGSMRQISFTNWGRGQPDNAGHNENCLQYWNYLWNDAPCTNVYGFVCQKRA